MATSTGPNSWGSHRLPVQVYYEDTDAAGIVYYANYLKFAERARTELLRTLGWTHRRLRAEHDIAFAVRRCVIDFHAPARLDDRLEVETTIVKIGGASLDLCQRIRNEERAVATVQVRLAVVDSALRPARLPAGLVAALVPHRHSGA